MPRSLTERVLTSGHARFLLYELNVNNTDAITEWVEENLIQESQTSRESKLAFYEAERRILHASIASGEYDDFMKLLEAVDHSVFDTKYNNKESESYNSYCKFKVNECSILAGAIIESKRLLEKDKSRNQMLGKLLHDKYQQQKEAGHMFCILPVENRVKEALDVVNYHE